jgi:hypothetical protein
MKKEIKTHYPAASAVVLKMFSDVEFHRRKVALLGTQSIKMTSSLVAPRTTSITIERESPIKLPGIKFGESTVSHEERWNQNLMTGTVRVDMPGMPVAMSCTVTFKDVGPGCEVNYVWTIESKVPLVGGSIEKAIASQIDKQSAEESRVGHSLLDAYR